MTSQRADNDIQFWELTERATKSMKNLTAQLEGKSSKNLSMCKLLGLDKQLRNIKGSLKVEAAKKFSWKNTSSEKSVSLQKSKRIQNTTMGFKKTSGS